MKKRRCTKALVKNIAGLTNNIFKEAVLEISEIDKNDSERLYEYMVILRRIGWLNSAEVRGYCEEDLMKKKEEIDELYLTKMIALSTQHLLDILFLHEREKPKRLPRTIEAITSELARRSLLDDSSQSDTK